MKYINLLFFTLVSTLLFGQIELPDSLYKKQKNDAIQAELKYQKTYYGNGSLKSEGWHYIFKSPLNEGLLCDLPIGKQLLYKRNGEIFVEMFVPYDFNYKVIYIRKKKGCTAVYRTWIPNQNGWVKFRPDMGRLVRIPKYYCETSYRDCGHKEIEFCKTKQGYIGNYIAWYKNGNIAAKGMYDKDSHPIGDWELYNKDGSLKEIRNYGKKHSK